MEPPFNIVIIEKTLSVIEWILLPNTRSVCVSTCIHMMCQRFSMESFHVVVVVVVGLLLLISDRGCSIKLDVCMIVWICEALCAVLFLSHSLCLIFYVYTWQNWPPLIQLPLYQYRYHSVSATFNHKLDAFQFFFFRYIFQKWCSYHTHT